MASFDPPSTLKPAQVAVAMVEHGIVKHRTRADKVFFKAVGAGIMLSFGGLLSEIIGGGSAGINANNPGLVKVLAGAVFPVGLIIPVTATIAVTASPAKAMRTSSALHFGFGQELLTSNLMIFPMACIKGVVPWWGLPWNWLIVTFGNLCGSLFFAAVLTKYSGVISTEPYISYAQDFALHKAKEPEWYQIFLRGIGCNWLVCVAVWIVAIWIPIMIFVSAGFDHVVANMFSIPLGIMFGAPMTAGYYIGKSLIPSYLGNIVGGLLVGLPAVYFYLGDYRAGGLRGVEEGEGFSAGAAAVGGSGSGDRDADGSSSRGSGAKTKEEQYEVSPGKAE
ncbi:hypothetical protein POSPLADRAFT_1064824 [Postia placenta MAD-698-R-SB12]|uniref:Formate/nitrite transporter n=1 Tax=Postia placenta MAD-698-R-SB12 TaxID=670580 RepID=A0A1X6NDT2_9APHY|nr:hypothetical protein POSPLADRAFT_1064824 [Postia placenta MAD-698-R-SB12]OSX66662.1 hypothetical protein POSPLADRAFT_1064824 [Postia placenta MAD-698-R-SB12]